MEAELDAAGRSLGKELDCVLQAEPFGAGRVIGESNELVGCGHCLSDAASVRSLDCCYIRLLGGEDDVLFLDGRLVGGFGEGKVGDDAFGHEVSEAGVHGIETGHAGVALPGDDGDDGEEQERGRQEFAGQAEVYEQAQHRSFPFKGG